MSDFKLRLANERRHLTDGIAPDEKPGGLGTVRFVARCIDDAAEVSSKARSVLGIVNENSTADWPSDERWMALLPEWFKLRCASERSLEEEERLLTWRRSLPESEQLRLSQEERWPLTNWIYWFKPNERCWYWWDAKPLNEKVLAVAVEVDEWPFPWGSLTWLLRASGAETVRAEE